MTSQILIGLGGLILSVLMYFEGSRRAKRRYSNEDRDRRIQHVVDLYIRNAQALIRSGPHGLHKAGMLTLHDDAECRETCERIAGHGERHPLEPFRQQLEGVDLLGLFLLGDGISHEYFLSHSPVELLARLQASKADA